MEGAARAVAGGGLLATAASALVIVVVVWVASKLMQRKPRKGRRLPPGPWGLPVVGNLLELLGGDLPHKAFAKLSKKYGPIVFLKLGAAPTILVSEASLAKACLSGQNDKVFVSRPEMEITRRMTFGKCPGISLAPYGDEWRQARKLCTLQLFTMHRVREFEPVRSGEVMALVERLEKQKGEPVNLTRALASLAEDSTCRMLMGKTLAEVDDEKLGMDMQKLVRRITQLFQVPVIGDLIPGLGFLDRKVRAGFDEVHVLFDALISKLIRERQQRPAGSPQVILDVLLDSLQLHQAKTIIMELLTAGIDSSSTVLDWAMAELIANPYAMRTLQGELDQVTNGERRMIHEDELGNLVYLKAVVKETMRLHTPGPLLIPHMSVVDCEVAGYTVPKGTRLILNVWAIGRNPKTWEEPERFKPERFLTEKGALIDFRGQHFELLPFGGGRRICPGMPLALPLLHSTLANLFHFFEWTAPPNEDIDLNERFGVVVTRTQPLMAIPRLRHTKSSV